MFYYLDCSPECSECSALGSNQCSSCNSGYMLIIN